MKRHVVMLLALLALGMGAQALAEDNTQSGSSTKTATDVTDTPALAADTLSDPAAAEPSTAADPMPAPAENDSK